jgi:hypothetical protein
VKKGLEHLVEKHVCEEEENLLQVVWHSMQDEFLKQYRHFEELIAKCYPDSGITQEFTIDSLLEHFSDIAQHCKIWVNVCLGVGGSQRWVEVVLKSVIYWNNDNAKCGRELEQKFF